MFKNLFGFNKKKKEEAKIEVTPTDSSPVAITPDKPKVEEATTSFITMPENKEAVDIPKPTTEPEGSKEEKPTEPPPLTYKEMKALRRSHYETEVMNNSKFKKAYVLQNIRTGQMVEIRAASSFHACNIIGWKPNRVRVIAEKEIQEKVPEDNISISQSIAQT